MRRHTTAVALSLAAAVVACEPMPPLAIEQPTPVQAPPPPAPEPPPPVVVETVAVQALEEPLARAKGGDVKSADPREVKAWANKRKD